MNLEKMNLLNDELSDYLDSYSENRPALSLPVCIDNLVEYIENCDIFKNEEIESILNPEDFDEIIEALKNDVIIGLFIDAHNSNIKRVIQAEKFKNKKAKPSNSDDDSKSKSQPTPNTEPTFTTYSKAYVLFRNTLAAHTEFFSTPLAKKLASLNRRKKIPLKYNFYALYYFYILNELYILFKENNRLYDFEEIINKKIHNNLFNLEDIREIIEDLIKHDYSISNHIHYRTTKFIDIIAKKLKKGDFNNREQHKLLLSENELFISILVARKFLGFSYISNEVPLVMAYIKDALKTYLDPIDEKMVKNKLFKETYTRLKRHKLFSDEALYINNDALDKMLSYTLPIEKNCANDSFDIKDGYDSSIHIYHHINEDIKQLKSKATDRQYRSFRKLLKKLSHELDLETLLQSHKCINHLIMSPQEAQFHYHFFMNYLGYFYSAYQKEDDDALDQYCAPLYLHAYYLLSGLDKSFIAPSIDIDTNKLSADIKTLLTIPIKENESSSVIDIIESCLESSIYNYIYDLYDDALDIMEGFYMSSALLSTAIVEPTLNNLKAHINLLYSDEDKESISFNQKSPSRPDIEFIIDSEYLNYLCEMIDNCGEFILVHTDKFLHSDSAPEKTLYRYLKKEGIDKLIVRHSNSIE